jgi:hypothetical protein
MVELGDGRVHRQRRRRAGKRKAGDLADGAAASIATNEIGAANAASAARRRPPDVDAVRLPDEVGHVARAADLDAERVRPGGQHRFDAGLIHEMGTPLRLPLRVPADQGQTGEMAGEFASAGFVPVREPRRRRKAALLRCDDGRGHAATL